MLPLVYFAVNVTSKSAYDETAGNVAILDLKQPPRRSKAVPVLLLTRSVPFPGGQPRGTGDAGL